MTRAHPETLAVRFVEAIARAIDAHADLLGELDRAIGDGDHGINMQRGFSAVAKAKEELASLPFSLALQKIGTILVETVGGASGPLYGSAFLAMGRAAAADADASIPAILRTGVAAVKKRGKSELGDKTMLDVLIPVELAVARAYDERRTLSAAIDLVETAARDGLESTRPLVASKGRASFLGERSAGHLDSGAYSSFLIVDAVCRTLLEANQP